MKEGRRGRERRRGKDRKKEGRRGREQRREGGREGKEMRRRKWRGAKGSWKVGGKEEGVREK